LIRHWKITDEQAIFIALGDDCPSQKLVKRLEKAPFVAVQASYSSQLTAQADVVLPVTNWTEQEGAYLNVDGKLQTAVISMAAPEGVMSNAAALEKLAAALGYDLDVAGWKDELLKQIPVAVIAE
jgi:NADH dehydrogenase/NADH:ubiquinone oxidoreductase subunit G